MQEGRLPAIERLLARSARALSGSQLHPITIVQDVETAAMASVRDGVVANRYRVGLHESDYARFQPAFEELRALLFETLAGIEADNGLRRIGDRGIAFRRAEVVPGQVTVDPIFADTATNPTTPRSPIDTQTRRITRHRGKQLVLDDGTRIPLTHTPFTIGRASGNDLVLLGMAVSLRHAEVEAKANGFLLRDLGSRNGLILDGARVAEAYLRADRPVVIGGIPLWLVDNTEAAREEAP